MKNIQYYSNGKITVAWDRQQCMHQGKCMRTMPFVVAKPGIYHIRVSDRELDTILTLAELCPAGAMCITRNDAGE